MIRLGELNTYLFRVIRNRFHDWYRRKQRNLKPISLSSLTGSNSDEDLGMARNDRTWIMDQYDVSDVREAIGLLSEDEKKLVRMIFWDGSTLAEIAKEFQLQGISAAHRAKVEVVDKLHGLLGP